METDILTPSEKRLINDIKKTLHNKLPISELEIKKIRDILILNNNLDKESIDDAIYNFFTYLGFPDYYFKITSLEEIARTIEMIKAYQIIGGKIFVESEKENKFIYIVPSILDSVLKLETDIDKKIIETLKEKKFIEIEIHKSKGKILNNFLNIYILEICDKPFSESSILNKKIIETKEFLKSRYNIDFNENEILEFFKLKSERFIQKSNPDRIGRYFIEYNKYKKDIYPVITISTTTDRKEKRIMITFNNFYTSKVFPLITQLFYLKNIEITRSYFSNAGDSVTISIYIPSNTNKNLLKDIIEKISSIIISSKTNLDILLKKGFSPTSIFFLNAFSEFAHQFLRTPENILEVLKNLIKNDVELSYLLSEFQIKVEREMFDMKTIREIIIEYPEVSQLLYLYFWNKFSPKGKKDFEKYRKIIIKKIEQEPNEIVKNVFGIGITFVDNILKTNFFKSQKVALSFKLNPNFLDKSRFDKIPYSIIFIYGKNFKSYHIRFQEIARGGIRIVKSRTKEEYLKNSDEAFFEVYNLAYTQSKKNKDIPEGGSKGIILPHYTVSEFDIIFQNYIDAILDIMLDDKSILKTYNKGSDILFLGPDEGTAHLMDFASERAKFRGYKFYRTFTTGKSEKLGGISHIDYGMTSTGIREYVKLILEKLNLDERKIRKVQTGGPDGDLGSNEILLSNDITIAVIDGSGVAYDPEGLNKEELIRLAKKRVPIINFDKKKLSKEGFVVSVTEKNLNLKKFKDIKDGLLLRDNFHFLVEADLFVPAGGRPKTINIGNYKKLFLPNGKPRYKIIVEGANIFITQDARIKLEESGIILIKDSSANKGGVNSSSLEVLSALAIPENEFENLMCVSNNKIPEFRLNYIKEIHRIIKENVKKEFNLLWNERKMTGKYFSVLSDIIGEKIVYLNELVQKSNLLKNKNISFFFFKKFVPKLLQEKYNIENIFEKLPVSYREAIVSKEITTFFIYNTGLFWIERVKNDYKKDYIEIIESYINAYLEVENIIAKNNITDEKIINLLKASLKERAIQILC